MRRVTDAALAVAALGLSASILWPRAGVPVYLLLTSLAVAVAAAQWSSTAYVRAAAAALVGVVLTSFARSLIAMPGELPAFDLRSLWLVALITALSVLATPTLWLSVRPASAATAAVVAVFLEPPSDIAFYSVRPHVLLQLAILVVTTLLIAFVRVRKWHPSAVLGYVAIEPVVIALISWMIVLPFVRDGHALFLPLALRHFLAIFGAPASVATAILSALLLRSPKEH